jgi:hypothetical protein
MLVTYLWTSIVPTLITYLNRDRNTLNAYIRRYEIMPKIAIELTYEKIIEAASKLSEDDKERLFFSLNRDYAKALDEMRKDAWKSHRQGESAQLRDL